MYPAREYVSMVRHTAASTRTIEDRIADADDDWVKARNSAVAWAYDQMDDGPEDIHARREKSVHEGEARDIRHRRDGGR